MYFKIVTLLVYVSYIKKNYKTLDNFIFLKFVNIKKSKKTEQNYNPDYEGI